VINTEHNSNSDNNGVAVIVEGKVVAWFADFNEEAREWCSDNHFGQWVTWQAKQPDLIPLTEEQEENAKRKAKEWSDYFLNNSV